MKNNISVITIIRNNNLGLETTLRSISKVITKPKEVIIFDGGSDDPSEIIKKFSEKLYIRYFKGKDSGIYDAMNKAKEKVKGDRIHYLNGGDEVSGDPYNFNNDCYLLPVKIFFDNKKTFGKIALNSQALVTVIKA